MLGVRDTERHRKVSVADCIVVCSGRTQKVLQQHNPYYRDVDHLRHLYCRYEARTYRCVYH